MTEISENHQRKILSTCQYADRLLEESLRVVNSATRSPLSVYRSDLSESEICHLSDSVDRIRTQMMALLERFQVSPISSGVFASRAVMTNLRTIGMAFNEILTKNMRGHGVVDADAAQELDREVHQLIESIDQLRKILSKAGQSGS